MIFGLRRARTAGRALPFLVYLSIEQPDGFLNQRILFEIFGLRML
jgi:hypothetical protein